MLFGTSVYCPLRRDLRCLMRETWFVGGQNENDPTAVSHGEAHALNDPNVSEAATSYQGSLVHHPRLGCPSSACFDCGALRAFVVLPVASPWVCMIERSQHHWLLNYPGYGRSVEDRIIRHTETAINQRKLLAPP